MSASTAKLGYRFEIRCADERLQAIVPRLEEWLHDLEFEQPPSVEAFQACIDANLIRDFFCEELAGEFSVRVKELQSPPWLSWPAKRRKSRK